MTSFYRINREKLREAEEAIENQYIDCIMGIHTFPDVYFTDNLEDTLKKVLAVFDSAEEFEASIPKKELQEVTNFNEETIRQLKPFFGKTQVYGHGTSGEDSAKSIIEQGLKMKNPNILTTAIPLSFSETTFEQFKNWPHHGCRYIVLIGISDDITPCIKKSKKSNGYNLPYLMNRSRIIGYIDSVTQEFIPSPYYCEIQKYDFDYSYFSVMSYNMSTNSGGFEKVSFLLHMLELRAENENIRKETFVAIYLQIKDALEEIKQVVQEKGITRKEYEEEQERNQNEISQGIAENGSFDYWSDENIEWENIEWEDETSNQL